MQSTDTIGYIVRR